MILLVLSAVLLAYVVARLAGAPALTEALVAPVVLVTLVLAIRDIVANPQLELEETVVWAVPASIRLHGLPWRRML